MSGCYKSCKLDDRACKTRCDELLKEERRKKQSKIQIYIVLSIVFLSVFFVFVAYLLFRRDYRKESIERSRRLTSRYRGIPDLSIPLDKVLKMVPKNPPPYWPV